MKKRTPVSKIMSENVITVNHSNTIREVSELIEKNRIRHVPVVSGEKLIGMISKTDLDRISFVDNFEGGAVSTEMYDALSIEQIMTKDVTAVQKDQTVLDAAKILSRNEFHALPVVEENTIVGIVTTTDLLKYLIKQH